MNAPLMVWITPIFCVQVCWATPAVEVGFTVTLICSPLGFVDAA